jgi:hypothetical protein
VSNVQDLQELAGLAGPGGSEFDVQRVAPIAEQSRTATRINEESAIAREMELDRIFQIQQQEELATRRRQDARTTIKQVLETYGLADLADFTYNEIIAKETVNIQNPDAIIFALREQPAYQKRFSANAARVRKGLAELDPATYIGLENQYRTLIRANGLPSDFYTSQDKLAQLIEGDVSPAELNERIQQGYRAVSDADPEVRRQMQRLYGVSEGELAAYFLDPEETAPILTRQARAAQIAARGAEQAGISISGSLAEDLARRNITEQEAQRGFTEFSQLGELRQAFAGEQPVSEEDIVAAQFGINTEVQEELRRRQRGRVAAFQGGSSFARTTGETSGSIRTGIGEAQ